MTRTPLNATAVDKNQRPGTIVHDAYGKSNVRLTKVARTKDHHVLKEINIDIQFEGKFEDSYVTGDNHQVVATDSMKNTVYALAAGHSLPDIESFGKTLCDHFLRTYKHVDMCTIRLAEEVWQRIVVDGKPHPHAFFGASDEKRLAEVTATREGISVESGLEGLKLVKTTDSAFWGFVRDQYTTLPEVKDRIFGTSVMAHWSYQSDSPDFQACYDAVRTTILKVFATHNSLGVQHTIHEIGQVALGACKEISEITITMPNEHRILFNLQPFGLENRNEIFVTTSEPYGLITATIKRKGV